MYMYPCRAFQSWNGRSSSLAHWSHWLRGVAVKLQSLLGARNSKTKSCILERDLSNCWRQFAYLERQLGCKTAWMWIMVVARGSLTPILTRLPDCGNRNHQRPETPMDSSDGFVYIYTCFFARGLVGDFKLPQGSRSSSRQVALPSSFALFRLVHDPAQSKCKSMPVPSCTTIWIYSGTGFIQQSLCFSHKIMMRLARGLSVWD